MSRMTTGLALTVVLVLGAAAAAYAPYHVATPPPPAAAQGGNLKEQLKTAIQHSGFAADGTSMASVQQHLGHALNCLEGTKGKHFNQSWGHVCEGQGNGILTDLRGAPDGASFRAVAEAADELALGGMKSKDLNESKVSAKAVGALLKVIWDNLK